MLQFLAFLYRAGTLSKSTQQAEEKEKIVSEQG
jgi:hypothetical protein